LHRHIPGQESVLVAELAARGVTVDGPQLRPAVHRVEMSVWFSYLLVHTADWLLLMMLAWAAVRWLDLPVWIAVALLAAWIVKDLLLFPSQRHYYVTEPSERRIVGEEGEALSPVDPDGFARVHGEIWQVQVRHGSPRIAAGTRVRVVDIDGLRLLVEPVYGRAGHSRT
jgi:membrane protein implicated in regulation of membrane protease activity